MSNAFETHHHATELARLRERVAELEQMLAGCQRESADINCFFMLSLKMLCIADFDGSFQRLNPAWEHTLGYSDAELCAVPWLTFVHPDDRETTSAAVARVTHDYAITECVNRFRHHNGTYRWFEWQITAVPTQRLIYAIVNDITHRRQLEESLRASIWQYRTLARRFPDSTVFVFDHNLRYLITEGEAIATTGFSREELEGKTIWEALPPPICDVLEPHYRATLSGIRSSFEFTFGERILHITTQPVREQECGHIVAGMMVAQDITEQKIAQQHLQQLQTRLEQLLSERSRQLEAASAERSALLQMITRFDD